MPDFKQLSRSVKGLAGAAEWPALQALLPPLQGSRVVDLGCGFGWFCRWACQAGAVAVLGVDVSENMLSRARADTADRQVCRAWRKWHICYASLLVQQESR